MNIRELLADIHALEQELLQFEQNLESAPKHFMLPTYLEKNQKTTIGSWILANGQVYIKRG